MASAAGTRQWCTRMGINDLIKRFVGKKKKPLIFVGARDRIDMMKYHAEDCGHEVVGILDKYYYGNTAEIRGIPIIGSEDQLLDPNDKQAQQWKKDYGFVLTSWWTGEQFTGKHGLDNGVVRQQRADLLDQAGVDCPTLIHPTAFFVDHDGRSCTIGKGVIISAFCNIGPDAIIGDYSFIDIYVGFYLDVKIGRNSIIGTNTGLAHTIVGEHVRIGADSWSLGINGYVTIGDNATLWHNSRITKDVPPGHFHTTDGRVMERFDRKRRTQ